MFDVILSALVVVMLYVVTRNAQSGGVDSIGSESTAGGGSLLGFFGMQPSAAAAPGADSSEGGAMASLTDWANAIFHFEGGNKGDLNVRNNNPGNLKYSGQTGATGADSRGFAVFSSFDAGLAALVADLQAKVNKYPDYTLLQIMTRYLGGNVKNPQVTAEGDPYKYANYVAGKLGVSTSDTLADIFG